MKKDTRMLLNIKSVNDSTVITYNGYIYAYFKIKESNISIMSYADIFEKVRSLSELIAEKDNIFFDCLDSKEDLENNKIFYKNRIANENNKAIADLLRKELQYLNELEVKHVTKKVFIATIRFLDGIKPKEIENEINRFYHSLEARGLAAEMLSEDDLKNVIAMSIERNTTKNVYENMDGDRWLNEKDRIR